MTGHEDDNHDPASAAIMSYKPPGCPYNVRQIARDSLTVLREGTPHNYRSMPL
jgi:hypothetical protein